MALLQIIKSSPLFMELYDNEIEEIIKDCKVRVMEAQEFLFHENDKGEDLFILLTGELSIIKSGIEITRFSKGELLGELVLINDQNRTTSCLATVFTEVLVINNKVIFDFYTKRPRLFSILMMNIARMLAQRLKRTTIEMTTLSEKVKKAA
jgi:CRP-like cAMP-binding protein